MKARTRGPGRPRIDPDTADPHRVTVRLADEHVVHLRRIIARGKATNLADAIRWVIANAD